jgi:hypothetical protein
MNCNEAAEFVSALCDGETIPRWAATHIGGCEACKATLNEYIGMGAELRRIASLELVEESKPLAWAEKQQAKQTLWQKGWETMRIPKFAFVLLVAGIVALASSLAMVKVHAHADGTVVALKVQHDSDDLMPCALSAVNHKQTMCATYLIVDQKPVGYRFDYLGRDGDRVKLGVRSKIYPIPTGDMSINSFDHEPQKEYWFEPGKTLKVDVVFGALSITGDWMDHMPAYFEEAVRHDLDPGPDTFRIWDPILLRGKKVVGETNTISTEATSKDKVVLYYPGQGLFELFLSPQEGAIEGQAHDNRIDFKIDGKSYSIVTATPITRSDKIWILHTANYKPKGLDPKQNFSTSLNISVHLPDQANPDK